MGSGVCTARCSCGLAVTEGGSVFSCPLCSVPWRSLPDEEAFSLLGAGVLAVAGMLESTGVGGGGVTLKVEVLECVTLLVPARPTAELAGRPPADLRPHKEAPHRLLGTPVGS